MTVQIDKTSIILVMGVSGSGKSTIAEKLAMTLDFDLLEGDDFHSEAETAKMHSGHSLTDEDRWPWLDRIRAAVRQHVEQGQGAVVACSALRKVYREHLLGGIPGGIIVYLKGDPDVIAARMHQRKNHFMPASLLDSQFATLEEPSLDEHPVVVSVHNTVDETMADLMSKLSHA